MSVKALQFSPPGKMLQEDVSERNSIHLVMSPAEPALVQGLLYNEGYSQHTGLPW